MRELTLHLLDIVENSVSAHAGNIILEVEENTQRDRLRMRIVDDGAGMDAEMVKKIIDPFTTSRTTRKVGLGIPLLKAAAEACNGELTINSTPGIGTQVDVVFQRSHIDRMPLGDLAGTVLNLVIGHPSIHWVFNYIVDDQSFNFDDVPIKNELGDIPLSEPSVISFLRDYIKEGIDAIAPH